MGKYEQGAKASWTRTYTVDKFNLNLVHREVYSLCFLCKYIFFAKAVRTTNIASGTIFPPSHTVLLQFL